MTMKKIIIIGLLFLPFLSLAQNEAFIFQSSVVEQVMAYNEENDKIFESLKKAKTAKSIDTVKLNMEMNEVVKKCFQIPQDYIAANPESSYCLQAIRMLGTGTKNSPVQIADLERLFNSLSNEIKDSREGQAYALQLKGWPWMNQLKSAARTFIKNSISPKLVKDALLEAVGKKAVIKESTALNKQLVEADLISVLKKSTLIVNMAYLRSEDQTLQVNPATAYVIDEIGICVTNYHVMKEYSGKDMYRSFSVMTADGKAYPLAKILACSESDDLVVFQVDIKGDKLSALPLGNTVPKNTAIYVMGHPIGSFYRFSGGIVTDYSISRLADKPCNVMGITADFNVGSSGGPIVDEHGNVVGTVSRRNADGSVKTGIPVSELRKLLDFKK